MSSNSKIEWCDDTWNPVAGCSPVSPGCTHCYAATMARRLEAMGQAKYAGTAERRGSVDVFTGKINLDEKALAIPLRWKKPRRIFVNSMSDLFHESVPPVFVDRVFAVMAIATQHTFQVLTKRPARMATYLAGLGRSFDRLKAACPVGWSMEFQGIPLVPWPLPNVWLGTSIEDQERCDRIDPLLSCDAAVKFLSCEPLLERVDLGLRNWIEGTRDERWLDWVIVGGESGPHARPMDADWARFIRDDCNAAGVAFFMKQMDKKTPIPDDLMIREFPERASAPNTE